jgi:hypothetical protein
MVRRGIALVVCLGVMALSTSAAPAETLSPGGAARYSCGAKAMKFYFWPQGHQAVPSVKFPPYASPHIEAYAASGAQHGFVDSNGALSFAKTCKQVGNLPSKWASTKRKTITTTMVLNCVFPAVAELNAAKVAAGGVMMVTLGHTTKQVVQGNLKATGSTLTFDTRFCRTAAAPAQATPTKYSFTGMGAAFSLNGAPVSYTFAGEVCGDPTTAPWTITWTVNGQSPSPKTVILPAGTATEVAAIVFKDAAGNELAKASLQLTFSPGPPPTMALNVVPSNASVSNIRVTGSPASVTATPVASC